MSGAAGVSGLVPGRSRKGAWIEIHASSSKINACLVAPVRERGLKCIFGLLLLVYTIRRSRKGAWIEILHYMRIPPRMLRRSRKGAWIEIFKRLLILSICFGRSRKGAWIEIIAIAA